MNRNPSWRACMLIAVIVLVFGLSGHVSAMQAAPLCGNGSAPDYGLTYDLQQFHWTVGWENYTSEQAVRMVDTILDRLNEDSIAQTMILVLSQDQVDIRPNCAVHFLRYMRLGLPSGERKDNGFVFLIVVEPESIDVHYAVGLGLPALTAYELTNVNRAAESAYQSTHSMDQALLTLVDEFDAVARSNYAPLPYLEPTPDAVELPSTPLGITVFCGQLCLGIFLVFFLLWMMMQMGGGSGVNFGPSSSSPSWGGGGFRGFPTGGGRSSPRMRGGSGSGRSGRTN